MVRPTSSNSISMGVSPSFGVVRNNSSPHSLALLGSSSVLMVGARGAAEGASYASGCSGLVRPGVESLAVGWAALSSAPRDIGPYS